MSRDKQALGMHCCVEIFTSGARKRAAHAPNNEYSCHSQDQTLHILIHSVRSQWKDLLVTVL